MGFQLGRSRSSRAGHLPPPSPRGRYGPPTLSAFFDFLFSARSIISICFFIHCPPCCSPAVLFLLRSGAIVEANRALRRRHAGRAATRTRAATGDRSVILDVLATAICVYVCMIWMGAQFTADRKPKRRSPGREGTSRVGLQPGSSDANMSITIHRTDGTSGYNDTDALTNE